MMGAKIVLDLRIFKRLSLPLMLATAYSIEISNIKFVIVRADDTI